jgi:phosphatidate cytidylyltransferase
METIDASSRWSGLKVRALSGLAMAVVVGVGLWQGGWVFTLLVVLAGLLMIREWDGLTAQDSKVWHIAGLAYVALPCASLIWLRNCASGVYLILFVVLVVCATDIGAYFAGRRIGGPKLAPVISPNKTWAGLAGGVVAAAIIGGVSANFTPYPPSFIACMDLAAGLALVAQAGDLFESWLKRRVGAKDSGALIPGHGGLLDRMDGYVFTVPVFAWLVYVSGSM